MNALSRGLAALVLLLAASATQAADNCTIALKADDAMKYDLSAVTVSASCPAIRIELVHTGKLPVAAMGHNVVITAATDVAAVASAGLKAGAAAHYLPKDDARIIASTVMIGGGQTASASFSGRKLVAGGDYAFFCSFPGHSALMKGKVNVVK
ncbi:azurin [Pseudoxanthomonas putridarboris]|uniref:Azurin n=1 Tax=Pseudoxanthomonas putridarboris TaxID=752605 RepID=A0ABU9IZV4_9GAMM